MINDLHNRVRANYEPDGQMGMRLKPKAKANLSTPKTKYARRANKKRTRPSSTDRSRKKLKKSLIMTL